MIENKDTVFFDTESQYAFGENGIKNPSELKVAVAGILVNNNVTFFEENQVKELFKILDKAKLIVGHNLFGFDYQLIQPYINQDVFESLGKKGKTLDMMFELAQTLGRRVRWIKLDELASRNIGMSKTHDGKDIPKMWRDGKHNEVKAYLINDLKMTEAVYNYALKNKKLKYLHSEYNISFGEREVSVNWWVMNIYTSPILGDKKVSEEIYKYITTHKDLGFQELLSIMRRDFGYGFLRTGILFLETEFDEPKEFIGTELYTYLINIGMSSSQSESLVKLFSTNNRLIERLVEQGFSVNDVVYGMDLESRLKSLNLKSATTQISYALEDSFIVHQLLEIEIEEPPPPEEIDIEIELIPYELPFTINNEDDFKELLKKIKSFEEEEFNKNKDDLRRGIDLEHEIQMYIKETGETVSKSPRPIITTQKYFSTDISILNRKDWTIGSIKSIYKIIVDSVIKRYKRTFGIESSPGENTGSNDWRLKINSILFTAKYKE